MTKDLFTVRPVASYEGARYPAMPDPDEVLVEEPPHPLVLLVGMLLVVGIAVGMIGCYLRTDYIPETPGIDGGNDGDPPDCEDGAQRCSDVDTYVPVLEVCDDGQWAPADCAAICLADYGPDYVSYGCDAASDNPCQCEYDMIGGVPMVCTPGDVVCIDEQNVQVCEGDSFAVYSCAEYCSEVYGPEYWSMGCNDAAEDPCQCEYNIIDGEQAICTLGEILCLDEETLGVCENEWDYTPIDCDTYCVETLGPECLSEGCDVTAEDPCQCMCSDSGSGRSGD